MSRSPLLFRVALAILALLAAVTAASAAPIVPDAGVAIRGSLDERLREIDLAAESHVAWSSHSALWALLEPTPDGDKVPGGPGADRWAALETELARAKSRGLKVELRINDAPEWASGRTGSDDPPAPAAYAAYGEFLTDLATRLGGYIDAYSTWNEPNSPLYWNPVDVSAYVQFQKVAYPAIKAGDPTATVLGAPLLSLRDGYGFLEDAYKEGLRGSVDAIGWIGYPHAPPEDRIRPSRFPPNPATLPAQAYLRTLIDRYDPGRKVWLTEFSWSTCQNCDRSQDNSVTEAGQADYLTRAYTYRRRYLSDVTEVMFWYQMRDAGTDRSHWNENHGLVRNDFSRKPAFAAMQALATEDTTDPGTGGGGGGGGTGVPGDPGQEARILGSSGLLPASAAAIDLPARAAASGATVAIGRIRATTARGRLRVAVPVTVTGGTSRVAVDAYRAGRWRTARIALVTRTQTLRLDLADRSVAGIRVRATLPGRTRWSVGRVQRLPLSRATSPRGLVAIGTPVVASAGGRLKVRTRVTVAGGPVRLRLEGFREGRWRVLGATALRGTSTVKVSVADRGYAAIRLRTTVPGRSGWPAVQVVILGDET